MARRPAPKKSAKAKPAKAAQARRRSPAPKAAKGKWVYAFGGGKAEGRPACANCSAARARASPRWRTSACRCRPASPSPPRSARTTTPTRRPIRRTLRAQVDAGLAHIARITGAQVRRPRQSAAGLGALRRARLDAGHDGHGAQPRPQRRDRRGAGEAVRRPALRLRQLSPLHHHVFQRGARHRASQLRGHSRRPQDRERA